MSEVTENQSPDVERPSAEEQAQRQAARRKAVIESRHQVHAAQDQDDAAAAPDEAETEDTPELKSRNEDLADNRLASSRHEYMDGLGGEAIEQDDEEETPEPEVKAEQGGEEESVEEKPAERMVRVVVDGEEKLVPEADVIRGYQKSATADRRLSEATETEKRADQYLQQVRQERQEIDDLRDPDKAPERLRELAVKKAQNILGVDDPDNLPEGVTQAEYESVVKVELDTMLGTVAEMRAMQRPGVNEDGIAKAIDQRLMFRDLANAHQTFMSVPDNKIYEDKALESLLDKETETVSNEKPGLSFLQVFEEADKRVRAKLRAITGQTSQAVVENEADPGQKSGRSQRKEAAAARSIRTRTSARAPTGPTPRPPKTRSQVIAEKQRDRRFS